MSATFEPISIGISCDARALKGLRQRVDLSGRRLAALMSVDPSAISRWSSGQRMPSYKQVMQLCRLLGVPDWKIVTVTEENGTPVRSTGAEKRPTRPGKHPSGATHPPQRVNDGQAGRHPSQRRPGGRHQPAGLTGKPKERIHGPRYVVLPEQHRQARPTQGWAG